jgi:hypothetical protein
MKPRLLVLPICKVDFDIWDAVLAKCRPMRLETISHESDRRDAALMWSMVGVAGQFALADRHEILAHHFGDPTCGLFP